MIPSGLKQALHKVLPSALFDYLTVCYWRVRIARNIGYEPERDCLTNFVSAGDWVVDVGVNMGQYAYTLASHVGPTGKVVGFEASPATFVLTSKIVGRPPVQLHNLALGNENTTLALSRYADSSGIINLGVSRITATEDPLAAETESVQCVRLDEFLSNREKPVTFLKCDVEGFESQVIMGAKQVIAADLPTLLVEIQSDESYQAVMDVLRPLDYLVYQLAQDRKWRRLEQFSQCWSINFLFVPASKAAKISH